MPTVNGTALPPDAPQSPEAPEDALPLDHAASAVNAPIDHLSWSQVQTFRGCPRKWAYRYVDQLEPGFVPEALAFGSAFHTAMQLYYERQMEGRFCSLSDLIDAFEADLRGHGHDDRPPIQFNKTSDLDSLLQLALRMLSAFIESELTQLRGPVIGVEETVRVQIDPDLPEVVARLDLLLLDSAELELIDFKTARGKWGNTAVLDHGDQLQLYALMLGQLPAFQQLPISLRFAVITKAKTPQVQYLTLGQDPKRAQRVVDQFRSVWSAMRQGVDFTNPSPMNCPGCPFKHQCPDSLGSD